MLEKIKKFFSDGHRIRLTAILCFIVLYLSAQTALQPNNDPVPEKKRVELKRAGELKTREGFEPQILIDSVVFFHDGAYMHCDSAYLDQKSNSFEAFSNIVVEQGDTLFLYGDYLYYDGNTKLLMVRNNVRLENKGVTLFTDSLNYDRILNFGYYFDGGMLVDSLNELTSYWGQYEPGIKIATFSDSVKLVNNKFTLYSDTLKYNTTTKIATILGPSVIISDSGYIETRKGWYNTQTEESLLLDQSLVTSKDGTKTLTGDSISYHRASGYGEVFGNMVVTDTLQKMILHGHYGYYNELTGYAMATDSAWCVDYSQGDSLYLHADTLKMITDSIFKQVKAYYGVRFYRSDFQGVCDSMQFNSRDSILYLYKDPILWNESYQLTGDTIEIFMNDSTIDHIHMKKYCFAIEDKDSVHFNQLKGRDLKAFFKDKQIHHILVEGNAESIFYPEENDKTMIGLNRTESGFLSIGLKNKKIDKLKIWPKPKGKITPLADLVPDEMKLEQFRLFDYIRPLDKDDIFRKIKIRNDQIIKRINVPDNLFDQGGDY
ncbi:hypothetical protein D0T53_07125 [Dysgonomonas sp. 216]|uniref:OstA-like protein n=1 Tax=Dysgonomonas sp. 216 TaxID=2302934 RepID=UPI0013D23D52|nr:OstA-like protein [Dysgonomonas sp. 216]NDW18318.1 hypothetical protein [Dysgonomonas sp. 216]NDW18686.1 hypothetical protein [Dysgonomonas sp. 216]